MLQGLANGHSSSPLTFEAVSRSDQLATYRKIMERLPQLKEVFGELVCFRVVIDAERIQGCLRWLLGKRKKPQARTGLEEAIMSGTIVAIVPKEIDAEIEKYLPAIADDCDVSMERVQKEWARLRTLLHVVDIGPLLPPADTPDPKDLPYREAMRQFAAQAVYSKDRHFVQMGVPVINVDIDPALQQYARASSFTFGVKLGSTLSMIVGLEGFLALARFGRATAEAFGRLPNWAKGLIVLGIGSLLLHPKSRAYIVESCSHLFGTFKEAGKPIGAAVVLAMDMFAKADVVATRSQEEIRLRLPPLRRQSAIAHARAVLMVSTEPLSIAAIQKGMEADGYFSKSPNFSRYLRSVIRRDLRFAEVSPGRWKFQSIRDPV